MDPKNNNTTSQTGLSNSSEQVKLSSKLLVEYDDLISSLQNQLKLYASEYDTLKKEISQLIAENLALSNELNLNYRNKLLKDSNSRELVESEIILNLRNQLENALQENEITRNLNNTSTKVIENLQCEIESYQEKLLLDRKKTNQTLNIVLEAKVESLKKQLKSERDDYEHLEAEKLKHQTELEKLKVILDSNIEKMDELLENEKLVKEKYYQLEQEYTVVDATLECVRESRREIEEELDKCKNLLVDLTLKNNDGKNKVEEALDIVEKALTERDAGLVREKHLEEEVNNLRASLQQLVVDATRKIGEEVEAERRKYKMEVEKLSEELQSSRRELKTKTHKLSHINTKYENLQSEISAVVDKEKINIIRGSETEITVLENQLRTISKEATTLRVDLETSLKENRDMKKEFSLIQESYERQLRNMEAEKLLLEDEVNTCHIQVHNALGSYEECSRRATEYSHQLEELRNKVETQAKLPLQEHETTLYCEFQELMSVQSSAMTRWKNEITDITGKFEEKIKQLKKEINLWKSKYKALKKSNRPQS